MAGSFGPAWHRLDRAAEIAKKAHRDGSTLREAALALGYVSADDLDRWLRAQDMVGPRK